MFTYEDVLYLYNDITLDPRGWLRKKFGNILQRGFENLFLNDIILPGKSDIVQEGRFRRVKYKHFINFEIDEGGHSGYWVVACMGVIADNRLYEIPLRLHFSEPFDTEYDKQGLPIDCTNRYVTEIEVGKINCPDYMPSTIVNIILPDGLSVAADILLIEKPACFDIHKKTKIAPELFYTFPELETLYENGYINLCLAIGEAYNTVTKSDTERIKKICSHGSSISEILKVPDPIKRIIKEKYLWLSVIDELRKLSRRAEISYDILLRMYDEDLLSNASNVQRLNRILMQTINKKKLFDMDSLAKYLDLLCEREGMKWKEGIYIIDKYLEFCRQIKIEPSFDTDSLYNEYRTCWKRKKQK